MTEKKSSNIRVKIELFLSFGFLFGLCYGSFLSFKELIFCFQLIQSSNPPFAIDFGEANFCLPALGLCQFLMLNALIFGKFLVRFKLVEPFWYFIGILLFLSLSAIPISLKTYFEHLAFNNHYSICTKYSSSFIFPRKPGNVVYIQDQNFCDKWGDWERKNTHYKKIWSFSKAIFYKKEELFEYDNREKF